MGDWVIRSYVPEDEPCCVSMWLRSYAKSRDVTALGLWRAGDVDHPEADAYTRVHRPIVVKLLRHGDVLVACDPTRVDHVPGRPAVIWAWACVSAGYVHWVGVKHDVLRVAGRDFAEELVKDLLGARLEQEQRTTFELCDLWKLHLVPKGWVRDSAWLAALRVCSARMVSGDLLFQSVAQGILEPA